MAVVSLRLKELVDVPVGHPLRCHRELVIAHSYSQQWQHISMTKGFPSHNLLAKFLQEITVGSQTTDFR